MKTRRIKKIPTFIGFTIIFIGLITSIYLVERSQNILLKARSKVTPGQIKISNINSSSFTVSWLTPIEAPGTIKFGREPELLNLESIDERDFENNQEGQYLTHYVTLTNLEPSTLYYFEIRSGSKTFNDDGRPYQVETPPEIGNPSSPNDLSYGLILNPDGSPAKEAIVYLNLANSSLQSSLVSSSGNWTIPLHLARNSDLSNYIAYHPETSAIEILVQSPDQTASAVLTTGNDSPVPPITLGQSLDFRQAAGKSSVIGQEIDPISGFSVDEVPVKNNTYPLIIINPQEGEAITAEKPEFFGKGPAGEKIVIKVESPQYEGTIIPNESGDWHWAPPENLPTGEHRITLTYTNKQGEKRLISHLFTVLAAEESDLPAFTASPSASPAESPSPTTKPSATPTPTPTPTLSPPPLTTPTSTVSVSPTPWPTTSPLITPTPDFTPAPIATTPQQPGVLIPTLLVFTLGVIMITFGLGLELF
ncbi:MAG: fibronectin type III domain-containing protein [Candidatus Pacebacteria bacterium]|nr:fibronectin type III domain-containing protein [Candidatus Paceibacterota bacterium]